MDDGEETDDEEEAASLDSASSSIMLVGMATSGANASVSRR